MEQHEVGRRISRIARAGVQSMMIDPQFDVEAYRSDHVLPDRSSSSLYSRSIHFRSGVDPQRLQSAEVGSSQEDGKEEEKGEEQYWDSEKAQQQQEPPYHVFTHKQKWLLVWIIGFAGLFSGLSSNIYFPSLDLIAQVRRIHSSPNDFNFNSSGGFSCRPCISLVHHYILFGDSRDIAVDLGFLLRCSWPETNLHIFFLNIHYR